MNFITRLIFYPLVVFISDLLSPKINFSQFWQVIVLGIIIAILGYSTDNLLLDRISVLITTWTDTAIFTLVIWASSTIFINSYITFAGALFTGILLGFSEYVEHRSLLKSRRRTIF